MKKFGFSFSWKRAIGISAAKQRFARQTGIPTSKSGVERKVGKSVINLLLSLFKGIKQACAESLAITHYLTLFGDVMTIKV